MLESLRDPYILCGLAGTLASVVLLIFIQRKKQLDSTMTFLCGMFAVIGMFIGAHLLFFLVNLPYFQERYGSSVYDFQSFLTAFFNASSGMVFYGGLLGAILAVFLFCRSFHLHSRTYLNLICCIYPLFHAFGRIGCLLNGCCYGIEYHGIFAVTYTQDHITPGISDHIADFTRFPVQPLEALCEIIICVLLVSIYIKYDTKYSITAIYLLLYGAVRFSDEFLRGDAVRGIWGPFSTSQWIALICILSVLLWYALREKKVNH